MLPDLNIRIKLRKIRRKVQQKRNSFRVTERIVSRDHNNLYITSSFFRDQNKYRAFCAYYAVMRVVNDRIDNLTPLDKRNLDRKKSELSVVDAWEQVAISCHRGVYPTVDQLEGCDFPEVVSVCESLITAFKNFPVSIKYWKNFFDAMRSGIIGNEFLCWSDFLTYAEGATVAPTVIYLSLIVASLNQEKKLYEFPEGFDLLRCARSLGMFAYLGHIIRDLAEDISNGLTRLCITREDMNTHGINPELLKSDALKGQASSETSCLIVDIIERAQQYLIQGRALIDQVQDFLETDCHFILELIITIYENIIKKIELTNYDPMVKKHLLSRKEKINIVKSVAIHTEFGLPNGVFI